MFGGGIVAMSLWSLQAATASLVSLQSYPKRIAVSGCSILHLFTFRNKEEEEEVLVSRP